jgi:hypothetical protein
MSHVGACQTLKEDEEKPNASERWTDRCRDADISNVVVIYRFYHP